MKWNACFYWDASAGEVNQIGCGHSELPFICEKPSRNGGELSVVVEVEVPDMETEVAHISIQFAWSEYS